MLSVSFLYCTILIISLSQVREGQIAKLKKIRETRDNKKAEECLRKITEVGEREGERGKERERGGENSHP